MKNRLFRLSVIFFCTVVLFINQSYAPQLMKTYDYNSAWKKVTEFENKGLPKSALEVVDLIYEHAKKDLEYAQHVKAIIYMLKYTENVEEDSFVKNLNRLRDEAGSAPFPVKPVLHSMLAEAYWNFYNVNRYRFNQRSETINFDNDDISTWSMELLVQKTVEQYLLSIENTERLQNTPIKVFEEIVYGGNEKGRSYRPTLFDFLAHRAVDFFSHDEPAITKPAEYFTLNSPEYFQDVKTFSKIKITSGDTLAFKWHALKLLQQLIKFHLQDKTPDALIDADLKRLEFVYNNSVLSNKQELYLKALEELEKENLKYPISTRISFVIAKLWEGEGHQYRPLLSADHKGDIKKAYEICDNAMNRFPESEGAAQAYNLQKSFLLKNISAEIEKVNVPDTPFRAVITYKNLDKVFWRVVKVTRDEVETIRKKFENNYNIDTEQEFLKYFLNKNSFVYGEVGLPEDGDFQNHSAEIKLDGLPVGDYMLIFSPNVNFTFDDNCLTYSFTTLSNLSYIHRNMPDGTTDVYIMERESGKPVIGAKVDITFQVYDYSTSKYKLIKGGTFTSNSDGYIKIPYQNKQNNNYNERSFFMDISWNNDEISTRNIDHERGYYSEMISQYKEEKSNAQTYVQFFLDRAIYRPGQTLYYKGLLYKSDGEKHQILPNSKQTVVFYNVNYEVVAQKEVTTNEFGTFRGSFTTPSSGLLGDMHLEVSGINNNGAYFSVEEYKRPKFHVDFDAVKGSYKLGEMVTSTGKAVAYSGAPIDGAEVKYRVVRAARFPYWYWCWYGYYPSSPEVEISHGVTETRPDGSFSIDFKAIPDLSVKKEADPIFYYQIYADVTDINGETHSQQTTVNVGYKSLLLGVQINDIDLNKKDIAGKEYPISSSNLSGEFQPASGTIKIWKLKSPEKAYRKRIWERPDQFTMTEGEFRKYFPNDEYADENNMFKWTKEKEVLNFNFNTQEEKTFQIKNIKSWNTGEYTLMISGKDKSGQEVKAVSYFKVDDSGATKLSLPKINYFEGIKVSCEPGETATLALGSSEKIYALYELENKGVIFKSHWIELNNQKQVVEIPISEDYRGNINAHFTLVKNSRLYYDTKVISVPFTNKILDIKFETFRDKLEPGEQEEWKIKISGRNGDKVLAEMVAGLYDASLDEFRANYWDFYLNYAYSSYVFWQSQNGFEKGYFNSYTKYWNRYTYKDVLLPAFDQLNWFGYNLSSYSNYGLVRFKSGAAMSVLRSMKAEIVEETLAMEAESLDDEDKSLAPPSPTEANFTEPPAINEDNKKEMDMGEIQIRKNFNETAFFYPHLQTNAQGEIIIKFTIPEALTRWKMLGFAHTKDLKTGNITNELVTQKNLMVVPNQPRFLRENDKLFFSAKVSSLVDEPLSGEARLEFFDALTMAPINEQLHNKNASKAFSIKAKQSTNLEWAIEIPEGIQAITYRIVAQAGNFSDGEEMTLPVVTNRMLVTETLPLPIRGHQTKTFTLDKLLNSTSTTLKNQRYTLEFTSNPAWYAIQSLPYMMEYPYECTEQVFSRFYANSIASHIANSNPKIKKVFDTWATIQPDALLSNLEKNQELKSAILEETPWVLNAKDESQRKRNVALLFDLNRMSNELSKALKKIQDAQTSNGGFTWFPGLPEDPYITQHIVAGMGHLDVMGVQSIRNDMVTWQMIQRAIQYLDYKMYKRYSYLEAEAKQGRLKLNEYRLSNNELHYLYARSYFKDIAISPEQAKAFNFFLEQSRKYWLQESIYIQGMVALFLNRYNEKTIPADIIKSLNEHALHSEELGMYWKSKPGWFWYQSEIERQALLIEVYDEVANDQKAVEELKVWLLKQKQVNDWRTTRATSEACYALLRRGTDVLANDKLVDVTVGDKIIDPYARKDMKVEAGTGYFKTAWTASEITPEMGKIKVSKTNDGVAWGAVYWQYFEQLDKITPAETPLKLKKQLFVEQYTDHGPVITPIDDKTVLKVGDLVKVRIELRVDRSMEYVHLKDMRASAFEPIETLSGHKYQDGLYYYESPRDLATNFFIGYLPQGTYVFEYPLRVSQKGNFSNGITTIQCMYAPEFSSHSEGVRVTVE